MHAQQTQNICITFIQCRRNVFDVGPTLYKCYTNALCLLDRPTYCCYAVRQTHVSIILLVWKDVMLIISILYCNNYCAFVFAIFHFNFGKNTLIYIEL